MRRKTGFLDEQLYREFIDDIAPTTATLLYYFMGEPFMHRSAYDMIRYARDKGIFVESCTNGDFVDAEGVIYSDINKISFQLGGMDQETHQRYRVRTRLDKAIKNIEALVAERKKHPESNVQIEAGFIVMRHNEHQVDEFLQWARGIGLDRANVIDPCARNMLEAHAYLPKEQAVLVLRRRGVCAGHPQAQARARQRMHLGVEFDPAQLGRFGRPMLPRSEQQIRARQCVRQGSSRGFQWRAGDRFSSPYPDGAGQGFNLQAVLGVRLAAAGTEGAGSLHDQAPYIEPA